MTGCSHLICPGRVYTLCMLIRVSFEMIEQSRRDAMRGDVLSAYVSARNFVTLWNYLGYMTVGREHV